jgi:hypothetical protein
MTDPVQEQLDAYNAHDLPRFLACYAPDVRIENADGVVMMEGRDAMAPRYGGLFAACPELRADVSTRIRAGDFVVDEEVVTGIPARPEPMRTIAVYRVRDGLIVSVRFLP